LAKSRNLIVYFSRAGNNYVNGSIEDLPVGNTEVVAKKIYGLTKGDLFRIRTVKNYPEGYEETTKVAQDEKRRSARPELTDRVDSMSPYDVIYVGYPNWWGTMPMAVFTFLESYDFAGKTIAPFCTHEGSGLGRSIEDIRKLCPKANVLPGLAIRGGEANNAEKEIAEWLNKQVMKG
jgi:flavodoxin